MIPDIDPSLANHAAWQAATHYFLNEVDGSRIYRLSDGWHADRLKQDPQVITVQTLRELERALRSAGCAAVIIPARALITRIALAQALRASGLAKIIFWEA